MSENLNIPKTSAEIKITRISLEGTRQHAQDVVNAINKEIKQLQIECPHVGASKGWESGMYVINCKDCGLNTYPKW